MEMGQFEQKESFNFVLTYVQGDYNKAMVDINEANIFGWEENSWLGSTDHNIVHLFCFSKGIPHFLRCGQYNL